MFTKDIQILVELIRNKLINLMKSGENIDILTDLLLGLSTFIKDISLDLRSKNHQISLHVAIPNTSQSDRWFDKDVKKYQHIISKSDPITCITNQDYTPDSVRKTQEYIDNLSDIILCVDYKNIDSMIKYRLLQHESKVINMQKCQKVTLFDKRCQFFTTTLKAFK